jgi:predicted kinase
VRGKVESLKSLEPEVADIERARARELACRYFALACSYARCHDGRPAIIVVFGAAGTGKSSVARALAVRLCCDVLNSDEIRKQLAGASPTTSRKADYGCGIYTEEFTKRTYGAMMAAAERRLADGKAVILDATFRHPEERRNVCLSAARARVPVLFVECRADEAEVLRRLRERAQRPGVVSDADTNVYMRQLADFVPPNEIEPESRIEVDTTHGSEAAVTTVEDWLARRYSEAHKSH